MPHQSVGRIAPHALTVLQSQCTPVFPALTYQRTAGEEIGQIQRDTAYRWSLNFRHHLANHQGLQRLCHAQPEAWVLKEGAGAQLCEGELLSQQQLSSRPT